MNEQPQMVVLCLEDSRRLAEVRDSLSPLGCTVQTVDKGAAIDPACQVVVADDAAAFNQAPVGVGRVLLGSGADADVTLPADASAREIATIARLLAETVSLRRHVRSLLADHQSLRDQALHDPLTGLLNRRGWDEEITRRYPTPTNDGRTLALAIADIDRFKTLNDTQGHDAGDRALRQIAEALQSGVRPGDIVARLGGDEFGILLVGIAPANLEKVLNRLRQRVVGPSTISLGGTSGKNHRSIDELMNAADTALQTAKRQGRDCVVVVQ